MHRISAVLAVVSVACTAAPLASADTVLLTQDGPARATVRGSVMAYSEFDPTTRRFRLAIRHGGRTQRVIGALRRRPFDAALGTNRQGGVVVTYSSCRRETSAPEDDSGYPGDGCSIRAAALRDLKPRTVLSAEGGVSFGYGDMEGGTLAAIGEREDNRSSRTGPVIKRPGRRWSYIGRGSSTEISRFDGLAFDGRRVATIELVLRSQGDSPNSAGARAEYRAQTIDVRSQRAVTRVSTHDGKSFASLDAPSLTETGRLEVLAAANKSVLVSIDLRTGARTQRPLDVSADHLSVSGTRRIISTQTTPPGPIRYSIIQLE